MIGTDIWSPFDLTDRVAIVTGAGSGIGRAVARLFAELGVRVVATDIDERGLNDTAENLPRPITRLRHDVASEDDWRAVFDHVASEHNRLDILVNNAGIMLGGALSVSPIDHLRRQQSINVESVYLGMRGAIPLMTQSVADHKARPSIVNLSSIYGQIAGPEFAAYSATKGAVRMLSKAAANELAKIPIRVNTVHPGPTATNLGAKLEPPRDANGDVLSIEVQMENWQRLIPMGRLGVVEDIAPVIAFLASDASRYMTGAELVVDGGYTAI